MDNASFNAGVDAAIDALIEAQFLDSRELRIDYHKPTHGNCCTCQDCGHDHDSCICSHNEMLKVLLDQKKPMEDC